MENAKEILKAFELTLSANETLRGTDENDREQRRATELARHWLQNAREAVLHREEENARTMLTPPSH